MTEEEILTAESIMGPEASLALLKLPLEERRRILSQQADRMAQYYEDPKETKERELWQGGDIIES